MVLSLIITSKFFTFVVSHQFLYVFLFFVMHEVQTCFIYKLFNLQAFNLISYQNSQWLLFQIQIMKYQVETILYTNSRKDQEADHTFRIDTSKITEFSVSAEHKYVCVWALDTCKIVYSVIIGMRSILNVINRRKNIKRTHLLLMEMSTYT